MCRVIDQVDIYKILKTQRDYVVVNIMGQEENHGHFRRLKTCYLIIRLMRRRTVPKSKYLRKAALRISTDKPYTDKIRRKIEKDKDKLYYYNPSKGAKK